MIEEIGNMDIYLLDQLMKGRITPSMKILDAGCGIGRNSEYFIRNDYDIFGLDLNGQAIQELKERIPFWNEHFDDDRYAIANLEDIPFSKAEFDFIISSAVLHFSEDRAQFTSHLKELIRVLRPGGILFIRMTTKHTLAHLSQQLHDDVYLIPDGSNRYLLDLDHLQAIMIDNKLSFVDPFKTVNVSDIRTMAVVVLRKEI
jgi:ubiquinone/menaquinone biosynthesis C-methylase UbiE